MTRRTIQWVNTPAIIEAMDRYKDNRLPKSMKLWLEGLLDISSKEDLSI